MLYEEEKPTCSRPRSLEQGLEEGRLQGGERSTASPTGESTGAALAEKNIVRFWSKVDKNGPLPDQTNPHYVGLDRCWVWTAGKFTNGYGQVRMGKKKFKTHRVAWMTTNGCIPKDDGGYSLIVMHRCDRKECCNPSHLKIGSIFDNVADRDAKGRQAKGDRSGPRLDEHG